MIFRLEYGNRYGDTVRIDITTPGLPTIVEVEGNGDPFILKYTQDVNDKSFRFLTTSANINIYETPEFNIDTLKTSSETDIKVERYINGVRDWVGFVIPDFFSKEIRGNAVVSMVASDRISTLKGVTLSDLPDMLTIYDLATRCLDKTGLSLPLKTMCDFTNDVLSYNGVFRSYVMSYRLYDTKGRSISCYDVLQSILVLANSMLVQRNAEWYIVNKLQHEIGSGRVYSDESTYIPYQEVVKYFSEITKGAYQSIIPVAASVGIYHEHGGGRLYPNNYDFSQGLTGWTPKNGFVAEINNKEILGYYAPTPGVPVYEPDYGDVTDNNYLVNLKNNSPGFDPNWDTARYIESTILLPDGYSSSIEISVDINAISMRSNLLRYVVLAKKGSKILALNTAGSFETYSPTNDSHAQRLTFKTGEVGTGWTGSKIVKGVLDDADLSGYEIYIRVYGSGTGVTSFVNYLSVSFKNTAEIPKGTVYKREQTGIYTKSHDTDTTIFGDYGVGPVNGYVYEYPIDDTSSLLRNDAGELQPATWIDPTDTNSEEFPLLRHIVRQKARMFSVAHDLIRGEIEMVNFDPLAIFVDCIGKRYSLVSAEVDFLRSTVNFEIEEIAYKNLTVRDFIYSYFGEGEDSIKSVGGIASGAGGGGGGGGMTPEQLEMLTNLADWWKLDEDNDAIYSEKSVYSLKGVSALGIGSGGGSGGGVDKLDSWANYTEAKADYYVPASLLVQFRDDTLSRLESLEAGGGGGGGSTVTWGTESGGYIPLTVEGVSKSVALSTHTHSQYALNTALTAHINKVDNPHSVTKAQVGLGNVLNVASYSKTESDTNLTSAIDNIEIGGRNLLVGSKDYRISNPLFAGSTGTDTGIDENFWVLTLGSTYLQINIPSKVAIGEKFTFSFIHTRRTNSAQDFQVTYGSNIKQFNSNSDVQKLVFTAVKTSDSYLRISRVLGGSGWTFRVDEFQLEKGDKATDWTPAPEDQVSDWSTIDEASFSYIKNKPTTLAGYGITDGVTLNTAQTITGAKTFSVNITASISVTTPKVIFSAAGWSLEQVGTELQMKHNGVIKQRMLSNGTILATGGITALST